MSTSLNILPNIALQANTAATTTDMVKLEGTILIPSICIIMVVVMVAGIVITAQKHKRY
jgi:hypothetical protein